MQKRGYALVLSLLLILPVSIGFAQDNNEEDARLRDPGITPDSSFYFVEDSILTKFRDDLSNVEKKAAEIMEMIKEGKIDEAKIALSRFNEYADKLEKEVSPDKQEEAKQFAAAIRNAVKEIESKIPASEKEAIDGILDKSERIATAAEIASKVKELCETLSKLDPDQYSRTCKTEEDAPKWQRKLDEKLTGDQEKEARIFIEVMTQCFRDASKCRCQDITITAFSDKCSEVAPLYALCQQGDEAKCEEADKKSEGVEDLLPDYLQEIMAELDDEFSDAQFEQFSPPECREANAKNPKDCMLIMVRQHAPEECISALDSGKISFDSERQFRKACEEIMFKENAPEECISAGLTDGKECGKLMFRESAPEECISAGLTGESPSDGKKCMEIMEKLGGERLGDHEGPRFNFDCRRIENPEERLKCFDNAVSSANQDFREHEQSGPSGSWSEPCEKAQAFTRESCENIMREFGEQEGEQMPPFEQPQEQQQELPISPVSETILPGEEIVHTETQPIESQEPQQTEQASSQETSSTGSDSSSGSTSETSHQSTGNAITGNMILNFDSNSFFKYFFG